jgi:hypothetical protein
MLANTADNDNACDEEWLNFCANGGNIDSLFVSEPAAPPKSDAFCLKERESHQGDAVLGRPDFERPSSDGEGGNAAMASPAQSPVPSSAPDTSVSRQNSVSTMPQFSEIYISTKTKIGYFDQGVNLQELFWAIPLLNYQTAAEGVIKKQIKISTNDTAMITFIENQLKQHSTYDCEDLSKNKEKYIRKISVGMAKKDLVNYRSKKKGAFYNCFVLIFRVLYEGVFREIHVKIFNTGKIEIPGIKNDGLLVCVCARLEALFRNELKLNIRIKQDSFKTVLINSNFSCGFFIDRERLAELLKMKYRLCTSYDPCSYPGIMNKFYYNPDEPLAEMTGVKSDERTQIVSFMIFRTGSVLIVGKCSEAVLMRIYEFIKKIFATEFDAICQGLNQPSAGDEAAAPVTLEAGGGVKRKKIKKQTIMRFVAAH